VLAVPVVAVGVERGGEPALVRTEFADHEVGGLQGDTAGEVGAGGAPQVCVHAAQKCIIIQHLLKMGHTPLAIDGVPREPTPELVVNPPASHPLAGVGRHLQRALRTGARMVPQQELDRHRRRELGRAPEAAMAGVVVPGEAEQRPREVLLTGHLGVTERDLPARQIPHDLLGDLRDLVPPVGPRAVHAFEDLPEGGAALPGRGRKIRPAEERLAGRGGEDRHRPAALPGHGLGGGHVDGVDVGPLLAVDLDTHEVRVEIVGGLLVLERLVGHDVAPVAAAVSDAQQHRLAAPACLLEGVGRPGPPVDGVVGVLEEVGRRLMGQSVRHGVHPAAVPGGQCGSPVRAGGR
jgi:hypothetical protein